MKNQIKFTLLSFILFINYADSKRDNWIVGKVTDSIVGVLALIDIIIGGTAWCFHDIQLIFKSAKQFVMVIELGLNFVDWVSLFLLEGTFYMSNVGINIWLSVIIFQCNWKYL